MKKTLLILGLLLSNSVFAAQALDDISSVKTNKGGQTAINVFDNVFSFNTPYGYHAVYEHKFQEGYVFDSAPEGQSIENWTSLITVTGQEKLATVPGMNLDKMMDLYSKGLKDICPNSFSQVDTPALNNSSLPVKTSIMRCGKVKNSNNSYSSHTMVMNIIRGAEDIYTLRYIELGPVKKKLNANDVNYFIEKNNLLSPVVVCKGGEDTEYAQKECLKTSQTIVF